MNLLSILSSAILSNPVPSLYGELLLEPPSIEERMAVNKIQNNCPKHPRETIDPFRILALLRIEEKTGVPSEHRGLLPAVFCIESGLQSDTEDLLGDPIAKKNDDGDEFIHWRALGPAQFHTDNAYVCVSRHSRTTVYNGIDWRSDFYFSAQCWIHRIHNTLPRAQEKCGRMRAWMVAEAAIANVAKYKWRCESRDPQYSKSLHWRLLEKWHGK